MRAPTARHCAGAEGLCLRTPKFVTCYSTGSLFFRLRQGGRSKRGDDRARLASEKYLRLSSV